MRTIIAASVCGLALAGCASITGPRPAPACDGYSRRPLNRSMWEWESVNPVAPAVATPALASPEPADAALPAPAAPLMRESEAREGAPGKVVSSPRFDIAASLASCTGEWRHG